MDNASNLHAFVERIQGKYNLRPPVLPRMGGGGTSPAGGNTTSNTTPSRAGSDTSNDNVTNSTLGIDESCLIQERSKDLQMISRIKELEKRETVMAALGTRRPYK